MNKPNDLTDPDARRPRPEAQGGAAGAGQGSGKGGVSGSPAEGVADEDAAATPAQGSARRAGGASGAGASGAGASGDRVARRRPFADDARLRPHGERDEAAEALAEDAAAELVSEAPPVRPDARPVVRPFKAHPASRAATGEPEPGAAAVVRPIPVRAVAKAQPAAVPARPKGQPPARVRPAPAGPGAPVTPVRPAVMPAQPQRRHWLLLASFLLMVVLPSVLWAWYLWARASDQYVSTVGFSVRKEETAPAIDLLGGLSPLTGGSSTADTDVLYDYIRSQDMVEEVDARLDLRSRFSRVWPHDFVFGFDPKGHVEDLTDYWQRQVKVLYDTSSDLITLKVNAFTPEDAQQIAAAVFEASSDKINELSAIARDDATRLAKAELDKTRDELTRTRQAMTAFRMRSQIVDPQADLASQMGVLSGLQAQLAEALVAHDLLLDNAPPTDHRVTQSQQKIDALRRLIESERRKFGAEGKGPEGESYSTLMAEYEKLMVDREFAEGAYRSARIAYESALAEAQRKSRYLAAHIQPKVAQSSTAPNRPWLLTVVAGLLLAGWSILALIYYSIRDRA